jgi:hypothetical protein
MLGPIEGSSYTRRPEALGESGTLEGFAVLQLTVRLPVVAHLPLEILFGSGSPFIAAISP